MNLKIRGKIMKTDMMERVNAHADQVELDKENHKIQGQALAVIIIAMIVVIILGIVFEV